MECTRLEIASAGQPATADLKPTGVDEVSLIKYETRLIKYDGISIFKRFKGCACSVLTMVDPLLKKKCEGYISRSPKCI